MKRKKSAMVFSGLCVFVCMSWILSCAVNPVTGERQLMLLSEQDEIALGKQTDAEIVKTYGIYRDSELDRYIQNLGKEMAKVTHRPGLPYEFKVLDTPVVNAFAVPGGYIYFTRGILAYFNNEAELAGVMGHELGHIAARHSAVQYSRSTLANLGLGVGSMLSERFRQYAGLAQFGVGMLFLKFSRDNERQADDLAVEYSIKTGYEAQAMADFFETLKRLNPGSGQSALPQWFSTHPNPENRVQAVREKSAAWKVKASGSRYVYNAKSYLQKLDGLVVGQDPRQGYVEGNAFYHPQLKFVFPVPSSWKVNNTPSQVQLMSKPEDALIMLTISKGSTPSQAGDEFVQQTNATVLSRQAVRVNGMRAQKLLTELTDEQQVLRVLSYFIKKDNAVYVLHGLCAKENFSAYGSIFTNTMEGFNALADPAKINVTPRRLQIKTATRSGSAREVLSRMGTRSQQLSEVAVLNGLELDERVEKGSLIKTISD